MNWFSKALQSLRHPPRPSLWQGLLKGTRYDYRKAVGDGLDTSVVTAPVQWIGRALPEARLTVTSRRGRQVTEISEHGALQLIRRPNAYYGDIALWMATVFSFCLDGNAYWIKLRNGAGRPGELWYVPHWTMEPFGSDDGEKFISHYRYTPGGGLQPMRLEAEEVVHFRHGLNPRNPRKGLSPLDGAIREIFMDLESSNFVASLLRNMGVPGVVISPKSGGAVAVEDVEATKSWFQEAFGGDRRGGPLVMGAPTDVTPYGFNPQQMNMSEARDVAEERVCACLGIPPAIVGFGAGLQSTKVGATMTEMRKIAWHNGVLPLARMFSDEIERSLLPDFGETRGLTMWWDTSEVLALQDDEDKETERWNKRVQGGWAMVAEARAAAGLEVDDSHRIYLRPFSSVEVPAGAPPRTVEDEPKRIRQKALASPAAQRVGRAYLSILARQEGPLAVTFEGRLKAFFEQFAREASSAALPFLEEEDLAPKSRASKSRGADGTKADELLIARILEALGIGVHQTTFRGLYEAYYLEVARQVAEAAELAGIGGSLPDPVARSIVGFGGRRAGLVDLSAQTRQALFDALAEGRAQGEGATQLAARIADHVGSGPWSNADTRARTIARTETKYAQNISTIERARAAGVERFIVFDGRLGPGRSLPSHIARNGSIVTAAQAAQMAQDEHPNGTLSFAPYFGDQDEEEQDT
ncbi:phage portal protein [Stappia sp. F7233]|uniref:Phage portal protein n=1 Tax=Stappia albiluteola TaxID=2758565 RepID=A0A839AG63_9HYPH|nr:phage portal protein [Stappia albiluteola]MBA5777465.1 phage portal protein [Stappia albiluteola]MBA5777503.1 phage portal protein [Stappia albiluteola]MBA5778086.1 phage portal protein [Stappia albiluteola]MBA5778137.1 phage portal protein [Stappia albiluteola]